MADLTAEQYESLPDYAKEHFEKVGDVYKSRAEEKHKELKQSLDQLDSKYRSTEKALNDFKAQQEEAIENAKQEALEKARTKGDVKAVEDRYKEQMEHLKRQTEEAQKQLEEKLKQRDERFIASEKSSILADLRAKLGIFDQVAEKFNRLIGPRIDINTETGERIFLDESGGATSHDLAGFISELDKDEGLDFWRQSDASKGGLSAGNLGKKPGGAQSKFADYSGAQLMEIKKSNPAEYERLLKTR